jgi:hypothetical protein
VAAPPPPSAQDRAWRSKHPQHGTCQILVPARYEWFQKHAPPLLATKGRPAPAPWPRNSPPRQQRLEQARESLA